MKYGFDCFSADQKWGLQAGLNYKLKKAMQSHDLYTFDEQFSILIIEFIANSKDLTPKEVCSLLKKLCKQTKIPEEMQAKTLEIVKNYNNEKMLITLVKYLDYSSDTFIE